MHGVNGAADSAAIVKATSANAWDLTGANMGWSKRNLDSMTMRSRYSKMQRGGGGGRGGRESCWKCGVEQQKQHCGGSEHKHYRHS